MGRIHSQALRRAAELLGGTQELCAYLQVPAEEMRSWIDGREGPPAGIFLRVVDLIVEDSASRQAPSAPPSGGDRREPA